MQTTIALTLTPEQLAVFDRIVADRKSVNRKHLLQSLVYDSLWGQIPPEDRALFAPTSKRPRKPGPLGPYRRAGEKTRLVHIHYVKE